MSKLELRCRFRPTSITDGSTTVCKVQGLPRVSDIQKVGEVSTSLNFDHDSSPLFERVSSEYRPLEHLSASRSLCVNSAEVRHCLWQAFSEWRRSVALSVSKEEL